jgi:predicted MPP superfamily phosphohydrolase
LGRGKYYNRWRQLGEAVEHRFYYGGWAARIAKALSLQGRLHIDERALVINSKASLPLKLAFVSDLHAGPLTHPAIFDAIVDAVNAFVPDVLLLGGDYVSLHHKYVDAFAERVTRIKPRFGIFGVFGNHDLWLDDRHIKEVLEAAGVQFLVNSSVRLPEPYGDFSICGLDEPGTGEPDAANMLRDAAAHRLVVMHSPAGLKHLAGHRFDLAFCGHTHGGQVALPNGRPIILPTGSGNRQFSNGHFQLKAGGQLLASRGIGMSDIPIRVFAPSEIHLCTVM